jgi:RES domain-containing protein
MILWRISNYTTLDGEGGKLFPARWHSRGRAIVYTADHPASSLCEMLANTDAGSMPSSFQLLKIAVGKIHISKIENIAPNWLNEQSITQALGDKWLEAKTSALLRVPSALVPEAFNYLLNPAHPEMAHIRVEQTLRVPLDSRLR